MSKVCVAICNFNHERFLEESIKSIISQDYEDLDITIVDDCSDNQKEVTNIVAGLKDKRIRYIPLQENKGKWNALNVAFSTTDAQVCTSHDADDISLPWRISHQMGTLRQTKSIHNLCGFLHCWDENDVTKGKVTSKPKSTKIIEKDEVSQLVLMGFQTQGINHYYTGNFETAGVSAMFAKWVWDIGFRFNPPEKGIRIRNSEDSDFNTRVTLALRATSVLAETPYLYRRNTSTNNEKI